MRRAIYKHVVHNIMSEPVKHHYVPQVYLNRWSYNGNGDVYTYKFKHEYSKVVSRNKSQICYEKNKYRFDNEEIISELNIRDSNIIEKHSFDYEQESLVTLFDKLDCNKKITKTEFDKLVSIIVDIKLRNPRMSQFITSGQSDKTDEFKESWAETKKAAIDLCNILVVNPQIVDKSEEILRKKFSSSNYRKNGYLKHLLYKSPIHQELLDLLSNWEMSIYHTDNDIPFITSDNPGFTIDQTENIYNTNFAHINCFAFPISPRSMILLNRNDKKKDLFIFKEYKRKKATTEFVILLNRGTLFNSNDLIISNLREDLIIVNDFSKIKTTEKDNL